jgi:predicted alpha-1,2-mannosidase
MRKIIIFVQKINRYRIMRKLILSLSCLCFFALLASGANDLTKFVNPLIGTGGHGHLFPGAVVPHGMLQVSPDTRVYGWDACSGYYYGDSTINGFSHTHLTGTGCCDLGDVLLMPTVGKQHAEFVGSDMQGKAYASGFSHKNEIACPGYYSVLLDRYGVKAEITTAKTAAIHRYTFPATDSAGVILDFDYTLERQRNIGMWVKVISDTEIIGHKRTEGWAKYQYTNFYVKFSRPFTYTMISDTCADANGKWPQCKVLLHFNLGADREVLAKVGISAVDTDGARMNAETGIKDWNFDAVQQAAHDAWNEYLSKIKIETSDKDAEVSFYSALYNTGITPYLFSDVDGRYFGLDMKVHKSAKPIYTVFSCWDTFRAFHPLLTIIDPYTNGLFVNSLVTKANELGVFPMWELEGNDTGCMIGYHAVPIVVDAFMKGYKDFDIQAAYRACLATAKYHRTGIKCDRGILDCLMSEAKLYKDSIGYIPCDKQNESVSQGLEFAYNDWCIGTFAKQLGDNANADKYFRLGQNYRNYFDPTTKMMRGRMSDGSWVTPFNPFESTEGYHNYTEGNAFQWNWFVPQDVDGLIKLMGGKKQFVNQLDKLFATESKLTSGAAPDISGMIGQYAHGNEPSHQTIYLFNYAGAPSHTQELVDSVLHMLYKPLPDGLCGNDDCGQMSAWYILSSMGFYQVCPGNPVYTIGRPLFDKVTIPLAGGKEFEIIAKNQSLKNKYVRSMKLNGKVLEKPFFTHGQLMQGGTLEVEMSAKP